MIGSLTGGIIQKERQLILLRNIVGVIEDCLWLGVMYWVLKPEHFLFVNEHEDLPRKPRFG